MSGVAANPPHSRRPLRREAGRLLCAAAALWTAATPALAACRQELAVYAEKETAASIDFTPALDGGPDHTFKIKFRENAVILDGVVMWTEAPARPFGIVMHKCPEGDVTGAELEACTVWQGVIYAVGGDGTLGLLPRRGEDAAAQILLPDLASAVKSSSAWGLDGLSALPWEAFAMSGCQE